MPQKNNSFLAKFAVASSVFLLPLQASAFTILGAGADGQNSGNPAYPANTGYNFFAPNIDFTILDNTIVGVTGGVSIDNTLNFANDNIFFAGDATVLGTIGATKAIGGINLEGGSDTQVNFDGSLLHNTPLNFYDNGVALLANNVDLTGDVDNLSGSFAGRIGILGTSILSGNLGLTTPLKAIGGFNITGGVQDITFSGNMINVETIFAQKIAINTTRFIVDDGTTVNAMFQTRDNNQHAMLLRNTLINGNIGEDGLVFQSVTVDNGKNATVNGDIFATNTIIGTNSSLSIGNNHSIFGPVDSNGAQLGTLNFLGNSIISFPIGAVNPLVAVNIQGPAGTTVVLGADVLADNVNVNNGGTLFVLSDPVGFNVGGDLTISNQSILYLAPNAIIDVLNDFNLDAGTLLQLDMGGSQFLVGGVQADNQAILDPAATIEIVNPGFVPFHSVTSVAIISNTIPFAIAHPVVTNSLLTKVSSFLSNGNRFLNVVLSSSPSATFANQSNTIGVATAIDAIASKNVAFPNTPTSGALQDILNQMGKFRDPESLNKALATLAPIVDGGILYESWNTQNTIFGTVGDRMDRMNFWRHHQTVNATGIASGDEIYALNGAWAKVFRQHGNQQQRQSVAGYKDNTWGIILGSDTMVTDNALFGISLSWATLDIDNEVSASKTTANSYQGTLYSSLDFNCPLFITGEVGLAFNHYKFARNILFNDLALFPSADFNGIQSGAKVEAGYVYSYYTFDVIPLASLFYSHLNLHDFQERGAGNASQSVQEEDFNTLLGGIGLKLVDSYEINKCYLLQTEVHAMAFYDAFNDRMQTTSQFIGAGPSFTTLGFTPTRLSANLGTSLVLFSMFNYVFTGEYDFNVKEDYKSHSGYLKMRYEFS